LGTKMWRSSRASTSASTVFQRLRVSSLCSACIFAPARGFASAKKPDEAYFKPLVPAVGAFHGHFGHFLVPYSFPVAADDAQWPQEARGVDIGRRLHSFVTNPRHRKHFPAILDQLGALGFPISADYRQLLWEKRMLAALRAYYILYGDSLVPGAFVVPEHVEQFPRESWGMPLGKRVAVLREKKELLTDQQLLDLESVEFSFRVDETNWKTTILPALRAFRQIYGHAFVKRDFVVPDSESGSDATPWPTKTRGLRLGLVAHNIRCHGAYASMVARDKQRLVQDGYVHLCGSPQDTWDTVVLPALRQFTECYGHGNVPATFVVPASEPWPRAAWAFGLGHLVHTSHSLDIYRDQLERDSPRLRELGVTWFASIDDKWDQLILPALLVYADVCGTAASMPQRFEVPSKSPWPEAAWSLRLGEMVTRIRTRGQFAAQRQRDRELLTARGLDTVLGVA
jgi:hypothetical protein